jgi:tRNA-intron endonuclease
MEKKQQEGPSIIYGLIIDSEVVVDDKSAFSDLISRGYGDLTDKGIIKLNPCEALYLVENNWLIVKTKDGNELSFNELLRKLQLRIPRLWLLYIVYRDLRRRGYVVKEGFGGSLAFRVYDKGRLDQALYLVYPFFEGAPESINSLIEAVQCSMNKDKQLIIAVVERRGEVIYYSCSEANLKNI